MKITIEPRKTTWVPFLASPATVKTEWNARIEYSPWSLTQNAQHTAQMRYVFSGLEGATFIPPAKLVIKEGGVPLAIVETVVSPTKDRFQSTWIEDPFIEIDDRLASIEKSDVTSKQLSKRVIERTWHETITRSIKVENKTNKDVTLQLKLIDQPAQSLVFQHSTPAPTNTEPPEYIYELALKADSRQTIKAIFGLKKFEKLELPPEHIKVRDNQAFDEAVEQQEMIQFAQMAEMNLSEEDLG